MGLKPTLKAAGLSEKTSLYDLRHSLATIMANNGEHPRVTAQLGESS